MKFEARPWQKPMISHIINHKRCNLWADMGSGKTSATLTAFSILQLAGSNFFPALVLAPKRVARDVWPAEREKFDSLDNMRVAPVVGDTATRIRALQRDVPIYSINYENIPWLVEYFGSKWPFKGVIADESTKLKNYRSRQGGKRAAALATVAAKTNRWVNLTGTPSPNGLKDLWGQAWFLDFGERLGKTYTAFKQRWFDQNAYSPGEELTPKEHAENQIIEKLRDITLTIQMKDWVDLREPIINTIYVDLEADLMKQYRELERKMFVQLTSEVELTAMSAAALTTKCLQFAGGAAYHDGSNWTTVHDAKLDALEEIIEETAGANLVVFYQYKHDLARILRRFPHAREFRGPQDEKDWNEGRIQLLLAHPQSAGHGLNLQFGGNRIVWFNLWWNLETYLQANERLGPVRQMQSGFDRPVFQYHIVARRTIEEDVLERLATKRSVQDILLDAMKRRY